MVRTRKTSRRIGGFTLIELLVVVIIIGILAAIALPNFIGAQDKAREASVKANMRTAQIAAEAYATDNGGSYPTGVNAQYEGYFPGGPSDGSGKGSATGVVNPFSNTAEFPIGGTTMSQGPSSNPVGTLRQGPPTTTGGTQGQIVYDSATPPTTYAVVGTGKNLNALGGTSPGTVLVLSNQ
jgi:prepilin-type N-terminal cleavage/methylation domain-containing protein